MNFDDYGDLTFRRDGRVLTILFNRPDTLNAVTALMHRELGRVFFEAADDPESDVIVVTGAGKAFSAGGDYNWMREKNEKPPPFAPLGRDVRNIIYSIIDCPKPIIARVNGDAFGLGASIALHCDIIVAADRARFADPHVRAGLVPGDGGMLIWPQLFGFAKAKEHLLLGTSITAVDAERLGAINRVVPTEQLDEVVSSYAERLLSGAQVAIRYTKSITNILLRQNFNSVFEAGVAYEGLTLYTRDHDEGVKAFLEGRKPKFIGE
jgi:enoyl-CoA hydratase/carnithine racemase